MSADGGETGEVARRPAEAGFCPVCFRRIEGGFAGFSFGAVVDLFVLKDAGLSDDVLEGFCWVFYHGVDPNMSDSVDYPIADGVPGGQMDIEFCSLACLKKWFCDIVDVLQAQLAARQQKPPR